MKLVSWADWEEGEAWRDVGEEGELTLCEGLKGVGS